MSEGQPPQMSAHGSDIPRRHRLRWNDRELILLRELAMQGVDLDVIAARLERSPGSVNKRAIEMGFHLIPPHQPVHTRSAKGLWLPTDGAARAMDE